MTNNEYFKDGKNVLELNQTWKEVQDYEKKNNLSLSIHDYFEWEKKNPISTDVLRCPKCNSKNLWLIITQQYKNIPKYQIKCSSCNWKQLNPFRMIFTEGEQNPSKTHRKEIKKEIIPNE